MDQRPTVDNVREQLSQHGHQLLRLNRKIIQSGPEIRALEDACDNFSALCEDLERQLEDATATYTTLRDAQDPARRSLDQLPPAALDARRDIGRLTREIFMATRSMHQKSQALRSAKAEFEPIVVQRDLLSEGYARLRETLIQMSKDREIQQPNTSQGTKSSGGDPTAHGQYHQDSVHVMSSSTSNQRQPVLKPPAQQSKDQGGENEDKEEGLDEDNDSTLKPSFEQASYIREKGDNTARAGNAQAQNDATALDCKDTLKNRASPRPSLREVILRDLKAFQRQRELSKCEDEWVKRLVIFDDSLTNDSLVKRFRLLASRSQPPSASGNPTTVGSLVSWNLSNSSREERGIKFNFMCIRAKRISLGEYEHDDAERRQVSGKTARGTKSTKLTFGAQEFAEAEFRRRGSGTLSSIRKEWVRYLSYGSWLIKMTDLFGGFGFGLVFPMERIAPGRYDLSTIPGYARAWLHHRVQQQPLFDTLKKLTGLARYLTGGHETSRGLVPPHDFDVNDWQARVANGLECFEQFNIVPFEEGRRQQFVEMTAIHPTTLDTSKYIIRLAQAMQLENDEWLWDETIEAVIRLATKLISVEWGYAPPALLLTALRYPDAMAGAWDDKRVKKWFVVLNHLMNDSDSGGNHWACAAIIIDFVHNKASVRIMDSMTSAGYYHEYEEQISAWLPDGMAIHVESLNVQQQMNSHDCGMHVICQGVSFMVTDAPFADDLGTEVCREHRRAASELLKTTIRIQQGQ